MGFLQSELSSLELSVVGQFDDGAHDGHMEGVILPIEEEEADQSVLQMR